MMATMKFLGGKPSLTSPLPSSYWINNHKKREDDELGTKLGLDGTPTTSRGSIMVSDSSSGFTEASLWSNNSQSNTTSCSTTTTTTPASSNDILSCRNKLLRRQLDQNRTNALLSHMHQQEAISQMFRGDRLPVNNNIST